MIREDLNGHIDRNKSNHDKYMDVLGMMIGMNEKK